MEKTAAGQIEVLRSAFSSIRGGTKMFFGTMSDGRFVVASRFQIEILTSSQSKAEARFEELCRA